jgi:hypothetical protein
MLSQLGYFIFSNDHYGIFVLSDLPSDIIKSLFNDCTYIVSESFLFLLIPVPESEKKISLVFPLDKIKNYPFYLSIYLFSDMFSEAECIAVFYFAERDIAEAKGYYRAIVQLAKNENSSIKSDSFENQVKN